MHSQALLRTEKILALVATALLLASCVPVPSLHPLFEEDELIFQDSLLGTWIAAGEGSDVALLQFQKTQGKAYQLLLTGLPGEPSGPAAYEARLGRLGDSLYLDVYPDKKYVDLDEQPIWYLLRFHSFYRVKVNADVLLLEYFDDEWLKKKFEAGELKIAHETVSDNGFFLTASTADLQALIKKFAGEEGAFQKLDEFRRVK